MLLFKVVIIVMRVELISIIRIWANSEAKDCATSPPTILAVGSGAWTAEIVPSPDILQKKPSGFIVI